MPRNDWGSRCPQCGHVEERDHGPGHYKTAPRCPECDWPMHCVDLNVIDANPEVEHAG